MTIHEDLVLHAKLVTISFLYLLGKTSKTICRRTLNIAQQIYYIYNPRDVLDMIFCLFLLFMLQSVNLLPGFLKQLLIERSFTNSTPSVLV